MRKLIDRNTSGISTVALDQAGQTDTAEDLFDAYRPRVRHEQAPGFCLAVRKHFLMRRGAVAFAATRAPGPRLSTVDTQEVDRMMDRLQRRLAT